MDITIHSTFRPHDDPDVAPAFSRDIAGARWALQIGPARRSSCIRRPPPPGITGDERRTIAEMTVKGTYAGIILATKD